MPELEGAGFETWGVVLAGGPGRRIGGNKHLRTVAGRRLIDLALAAVGRVCPKVMVVAGKVEPFAELGCRVLADRWPGQGPLAAIATAFLDSEAPAILVVPVDLPLLRPAVLELVAAAEPGQMARAPVGPRGLEPLVAWYSRVCLPRAMSLLARGERRSRRLLEDVDATFLEWEQVRRVDPEGLSFMNINYPEDLEAVNRLAAARGLIDTP